MLHQWCVKGGANYGLQIPSSCYGADTAQRDSEEFSDIQTSSPNL